MSGSFVGHSWTTIELWAFISILAAGVGDSVLGQKCDSDERHRQPMLVALQAST